MVWRMTVSYVAIGTVVRYLPDEHDGEEDCGWWKVHILGQGFRHSEAEWLHPGILAKINGRILVEGDDQPHAWPATFDRMSCHKMGERENPSREELRHTGYCEACIRRMVRFPSFIQHLLQAIRLLEKTDGLTLVCKAGLHRSVTIGHLILALTACESGFTPWRSCSLRCLNVRLLPALKLFFKRSNDFMGQASVSCASKYFGGLGWEDDYRGVSHVLRGVTKSYWIYWICKRWS